MGRIIVLLMVGLLAGPWALAQCPDGANLVENCGFEIDDSGWMATKGDWILRTLLAARTGIASLMGNAQVEGSGWRLVAETCVGVAFNTGYDSGAFVQLATGSDVLCRVTINEFDQADCMSFVFGYWSPYESVGVVGWKPVDYRITSDVNTKSLLLGIDCSSATGDFEVYIDDAFLGIGIGPIFTDGFESGGTDFWDHAMPGP